MLLTITKFRRTKSAVAWLLTVCIFAVANPAFAADDELQSPAANATAQKSDASKSRRKSKPDNLTVEQQDAALRFAGEHHAELAELLLQLRTKSPKGFARGIREVHSASQRLDRFRLKQPARFDSELSNWVIGSEIRLLTARWMMSQDPDLEKEIRELLKQRQQIKIDRLKTERKKLAERLQQLDRQIGMDTEERAADLVAEWDRLVRRAAQKAKAHGRPGKKAAQKSVTRAAADSR